MTTFDNGVVRSRRAMLL